MCAGMEGSFTVGYLGLVLRKGVQIRQMYGAGLVRNGRGSWASFLTFCTLGSNYAKTTQISMGFETSDELCEESAAASSWSHQKIDSEDTVTTEAGLEREESLSWDTYISLRQRSCLRTKPVSLSAIIYTN